MKKKKKKNTPYYPRTPVIIKETLGEETYNLFEKYAQENFGGCETRNIKILILLEMDCFVCIFIDDSFIFLFEIC